VAITETNKAVFLLTCIQNIVEGMASVKYCDDSLVEFLQWWGGAVGQMLGLNLGTRQDQVHAICLRHCHGQGGHLMLNYLTLDTVFKTAFITMSFSLPLAQLTGNNFCASTSNHTWMTFCSFSQGSSQDELHQRIVALSEALGVMFSLIFFPFFLCKKLWIC